VEFVAGSAKVVSEGAVVPSLNSVESIVPYRVSHVIAGLEPAHGGPSYSVPRLCQALADLGIETELLSVSHASQLHHDVQSGYADRRFAVNFGSVPVLKHLRGSFELSRALCERRVANHVIHNHGLWLLPNVQASWAASRLKIPLVIAPRGMLAPAALTFSRVRKSIFWQLAQRRAARRANCFHATSFQEYEEIRGMGLHNPVAIVPNGIDLPESRESLECGKDFILLSLGRIHPKKGLDRLLRAWQITQGTHPNWRLRIIGPGEARHIEELQCLANALKLRSVSIEPPIYGEAKLAAFRSASLFVLPSLNENFAMTVAESLAAEVPVIVTKGAPWNDLEAEGCGWWIDHGVEPLARTLDDAMTLPRAQLRLMGARGRAWMGREYGWDAVARKIASVYAWLHHRSERPQYVQLH
jgi:glycosyltransferase involved in cell wall biosynthesis